MSIHYNDLKRTGFATLAKGLAAVSAFIMTAIIARKYNVENAGFFFISFTFFSFLSIFFKLGLDSIIIREVSSKGLTELTNNIFTRILIWVTIVQAPFIIIFCAFGSWICSHVLKKPELYDVLFWFIISLPFAMFYLMYSCVSLGKGWVIRATFFQNLGVSVVFIPMMIVTLIIGKLGIQDVAKLFFLSNIVVFCIALYELFLKTNYKFKKVTFFDNELFASCKNLWLGSVMTLIVWWGSIVISSFILHSEEVAILSAAQRTAYITSFILMISNMSMAHRFSHLWFKGEIILLKSTVLKMTRLLIIVAIPILVIILSFPAKIMSVFGKEYVVASSALILFALGQFTNIIAGSASTLLNMTGNERLYKIASLFGGLTAVIFGVVLTYFYGVLGAAASTAIAMLAQNIVLVYFIKKKFDFYMFI
jgi:O-antigen/teichoic acid export membrane protein